MRARDRKMKDASVEALHQQSAPSGLLALLNVPSEFLELLPIAAYACDAAGRILWFNERAAALWGREPGLGDDSERFCGSYRLFFGGREISHEEAPMAAVLRTGEPVHGAEGQVERPDGSRVWATVHIEPVKDAAGRVLGAINCFHDTTELHQARAEIAASEAQTRRLLDAMPAAIYTTDDVGRITYYNEAAIKLAGRRPTLGSDEWCVTWKLYWPDGTRLPHDQCPMALALKEQRPNQGMEAIAERPDGSRVPFIPYPSPLFDASGKLVGAVNMLVDISERKRAEEHQTLLLNELNHRVKNTLATVQSLALQTLRNSSDTAQAGEQINARLIALSKAHDILTREQWEGASLRRIIEEAVTPYGDRSRGRFDVEGPDVWLSPKYSLALAMALHELCTNAIKYGSLSNAVGRVGIAWGLAGIDGSCTLRMRWSETGGPPVGTPSRRGFGSRLIESGLKHDLNGDVRIEFAPSGVVCHIEAVLEQAGRPRQIPGDACAERGAASA